MYKVMIVDDEWLVRQGLKQTIPWSEMECTVIHEAADGEEALKMLGAEPPDIVLTDIRMPGMDGLELARRIKLGYPEIKTIFLTGFDDFQYARTALKMGAFDILLKPTNPDEINRVFKEATFHISELRSRTDYTQKLEHRIRNSEPLITEKIFHDLLMNRADGASLELLKELPQSGIRLFEAFRVVLVKTALPRALPEIEAVLNLLQEYTLAPPIVIGQETSAFIISDPGTVHLTGKWQDELGNSRLVQEGKVAFSISTAHQGIQSLSIAYEEAKFAMHYNTSLGLARFSQYETVVNEALWHHPAEWSDSEVLGMIKWESPSAITHKVQGWYLMLLEQSDGNEAVFMHQLVQLMFGVYSLLTRYYWDLGCLPDTRSFLDTVQQRVAPLQILDWLDKVLYDVQTAYLNSKQQGRTEFDNVMDYINANFDKELSMHDIASGLHMSESHFSRIFKKKIGTNFLEYITDLRMNKAREMLLHTDMRVYEVSLSVGYQDARYFSQLFRKVTGETPSEFRQAFVLNG